MPSSRHGCPCTPGGWVRITDWRGSGVRCSMGFRLGLRPQRVNYTHYRSAAAMAGSSRSADMRDQMQSRGASRSQCVDVSHFDEVDRVRNA